MRSFLLFVLFSLAMLIGSSAPLLPAAPDPRKWKQIDALLAKNQTASAATLVEELYRQARQQQDTPEYLRALLYKLRLLEAKEEEADEKAIALLEADLKVARFPARPVLHSLLGQLYAAYYQQHRYQLYNRTAGGAASTADIQTWDAARLGSAVVRHYRASVADEPGRQQQVLLKSLGYAIEGGTAETRSLRPTLYDVLAHRAIDALGNEEYYITRPAEQFQPTDPALFGPAPEFARLPLAGPAADSLNGRLHALRVLQELTAFRLQQAGNRAALASVDLKRIDFLRLSSPQLSAAYLAALVRLADEYRALPISTEFLARQAQEYRAGQPEQAVAAARTAEERFPTSRGAKMARRIREEIEQPTLSFSTDEVVLPGQPWALAASGRNVRELHAWAYRITLDEWKSYQRYQQRREVLFAKRYARALATAPAAAWTVPVLAAPTRYAPQEITGAGAALPLGHYLILLSNQASEPSKARPGGTTSYAVLSVSELSALTRFDDKQRETSVLLLHRRSGTLLPEARVIPVLARYNSKTRQTSYRSGPAQQPDATGELRFPATEPQTVAAGQEYLDGVQVVRGADTLEIGGFAGYHPAYYEPSEAHTQRQTFLYTDRSIYRPGQTLYFKGIVAENTGGKARLLVNEAVTVRLVDVNGQTVQTMPFTSSVFGSFHGSLVLPTGLLNGQMSLQTEHGSVGFGVEDYKRPTFAVTFQPITGTPALGKEITLRGQAAAYAGQPVDGATVSYRVVRRVLLPLFSYDGRGLPGREGTTEIAQGTAQTDADGNFTVSFVAAPSDVPAGLRWQPGHLFEVTADVTDAAGETRTGKETVLVGNQPVQLRLEMPALLDRQRLPALHLYSMGATGQPRPVAGTLRLYALTPQARPAGLPEFIPVSEDNQPFDQKLVRELPFSTEKTSVLDLNAVLSALPTGRYELEARATTADSAQARQRFTLYDSQAATIPYATPDWVVSLQDTVAAGQTATLLLGSRNADTRVLLEVEGGGQLLRKEWLTLAANEQRRVLVPADPSLQGRPLYIHITQVRDNRLYRHTAVVRVVLPPAPLSLGIATFRDKLQPGQKETWRVTIRQADGKPADGELLATLYDQSLDVFQPHSFAPLVFQDNYYPIRFAWQGEFAQLNSRVLFLTKLSPEPAALVYPALNTWGAFDRNGGGMLYEAMVVSDAMAAPAPAGARASRMAKAMSVQGNAAALGGVAEEQQAGMNDSQPRPDLSGVQARKDFRETALWLPALRTNAQGEMVLEFQMPEAVTRWQLLALAHDQQLHTGLLRRELLTQKPLQVTPNAPRFFREGDQLRFSAKLSNLTAQPLNGTAQLFLLDARTQQPLESRLLKGAAQQNFALAANQSSAVEWELTIPETAEGQVPLEAITYRVVAQGQVAGGEQKAGKKTKGEKRQARNEPPATFSDGEENTLPVLTNRVLITESLPLPIVGPATREFVLPKLASTTSATRRNYSLTLEMTANPAWYAVQALPYLLEPHYETSEQVFGRLYANLIAARILSQNPKLQPVLAEWKRAAQAGNQAALASKLEQNQELKTLLLQETPWVREAQTETERMRRLTELFDGARLQRETTQALTKLARMQQPTGAFPWFEKMPDDRYITQLIVAGFGKLRQLGAFDAQQDALARPLLDNALRYLDEQLQQDYTELRRQKNVDLKQNHLQDLHIQALYARSFWPQPTVVKAAQPALAYYQQQVATHWAGQTRYLQALTALALHRGKSQPAVVKDIMRGLSENALHSPELGMYWKEVRGGYYWREAPTETQATLIEAYDEISNDQKAVDEMKLWLLKRKQTQSWESTRATADACYALLLRGSDWLQPAAPLRIQVGPETVKPTSQQAGTGYFKTTWPAADVKAAQGTVTVQKPDAGVAWGALYWQYFEQLDKVTPAATPLSLERQLFREQRTAGGPVLEPLTSSTPLRVGDVLVVRLVLRSDRDLEYVHLKDQRAAGLELIGQTSGYRYQGGLGYYESPRDAATSFFLSSFPKGTHTFEYRLRAAQSGNFSGGLSQIQCLYAPEFTSHAAGARVQVEPLGRR
ncbi:hypothetical protein LGH70_00280 [Hymenobacter sp. BT635]|uniref:Alpha-2-macroglobulin domain-containing protein n=1 Tax=Hymenobacter nitidus TaxID=2880929 RepID=A0ABS8A6H7_9BACT|nr:MG2 domain-containing protein [Hymenobacter nitidus]MCB2375998.1 hypothetical protein [Hymenobacter nitidus]